MEDSDGISVISESEMYKNNSNPSDSEVEKPQMVEQAEEADEELEEEEDETDEEEESVKKNEKSFLLTPPNTPEIAKNSDETEEEQEEIKQKAEEMAVRKFEGTVREVVDNSHDTFKCSNSNHGVILLIGMSLIIAVLYTNISSLKNEFSNTVSIYEQRIVRLEQENQLLRSQLDELMKKLKIPNNFVTPRNDDDVTPNVNYEKQPVFHESTKEEKPREPKTKKVWLGGEKEEVVKILDKKFTSPDYCYFTDKDDLFYEYNMENCGRKKQKLDEEMKKVDKNREHKEIKDDEFKFTADDIYKTHTDEKYEDFITKTTDEILKSLNDEIQEIKKSRFSASLNHDDDKKPLAKEKFKGNEHSNNNEGSNKRKSNEINSSSDEKFNTNRSNKKRRNPKLKDSGEWIEKRSAAREAARNNNEKEENWYLKRKNDREIHRMDTARS